jgi:hypothetical protein
MLWNVISTLALGLWFGGGVVAGFVAPQAAFGVLTDRQVAGSIAGAVLSRYSLIAIASGIAYCGAWFGASGGSRPYAKVTLILVVIALLVVCFSQFVLTPKIADLRAEMRAGGETPELQGRFGAYHRWSVILFTMQWLLVSAALVRHSMRSTSRT